MQGPVHQFGIRFGDKEPKPVSFGPSGPWRVLAVKFRKNLRQTFLRNAFTIVLDADVRRILHFNALNVYRAGIGGILIRIFQDNAEDPHGFIKIRGNLFFKIA
jgi:hypothetical protein